MKAQTCRYKNCRQHSIARMKYALPLSMVIFNVPRAIPPKVGEPVLVLVFCKSSDAVYFYQLLCCLFITKSGLEVIKLFYAQPN